MNLRDKMLFLRPHLKIANSPCNGTDKFCNNKNKICPFKLQEMYHDPLYNTMEIVIFCRKNNEPKLIKYKDTFLHQLDLCDKKSCYFNKQEGIDNFCMLESCVI